MMTYEQFQQLEAAASAAWDEYKSLENTMIPVKQKWHALYTQANREREKRALFAELEAERKAPQLKVA